MTPSPSLMRADQLQAGDVLVGTFGKRTKVLEVDVRHNPRGGAAFVHVRLEGLPKTRYEHSFELWVERAPAPAEG